MAKRKTYGKTWWGHTWIEAISRIDHNTNRLPRGKTYANTGRVKDIVIGDDGKVYAQVKGTGPQPYKVSISLRNFAKTEIDNLKKLLASQLDISTELNLGKLPESLLDELKKQDIELLPQSWDDIEAKCSCPDWANPCKHLAAVYYIIANEVDKNPFLLFNMKGVSIEEIVQATGFNYEANYTYEKDIYENFKSANEIKAINALVPVSEEEIELNFPDVDIDSIFTLLPENPLFYPDSDFKEILKKIYARVSTDIDMISIIEEEINLSKTNLYLCFDENDEAFIFTDTKKKNLHPLFSDLGKRTKKPLPKRTTDEIEFKDVTGYKFTIDDFTELYMSFPLDLSSKNNTQSTRFFNFLIIVASSIIKSACFVPKVVHKDKKTFTIKYTPIIYNDTVEKTIGQLKQLMPDTTVYHTKYKSLLSNDGVNDLLTLFITNIIKFLSQGLFLPDDKLVNIFTHNQYYEVKTLEDEHISQSISNWLEKLYVRQKPFSPVVKLLPAGEREYSVDIEVIDNSNPLAKTFPFETLFDEATTEIPSYPSMRRYPADTVRTEVSKQLMIASDYMPVLSKAVKFKGKHKPLISSVMMANVLSNVSRVFKLLGIRISLPKELKNILRPNVSVKAKLEGAGKVKSFLSLGDFAEFSYQVALGDKVRLSKKEFLTLVKSAEGVVKYKDEFILLDPNEVKKIIKKLDDKIDKQSTMDVIQAGLTNEFEGLDFDPDSKLKKLLNDLTKVSKNLGLPKTLKAKLRPYQKRGYRWLYSNVTKGLGSCIADDMGLGKTIQVISLILRLKEEGKLEKPCVVICPTTLVGNWQKECQRFAPKIRVSIYYGSKRVLQTKNKDVVITTYGIVRQDKDKFKKKEWTLCIIDEAQNIKNPETGQSKAVKQINAWGYIAMTGTPVENRLVELWSIFDFINKGYLGHLNKFKKNYILPIEKYREKKQIEKLRHSTSPFILRRLKTDKKIISDLPEKIEIDEYCNLTKEQAVLYHEVLKENLDTIEDSEGIKRKGIVLKLITALKQICNHPVQFTGKGRVSKKSSGKSKTLLSILEKIFDAGEKSLIFTQYKQMGMLLSKMIKDEFGFEPLFFHGGVRRKKRDEMVNTFQTDKSCKLMLISLKAGGTGLNLTEASNVIHYDLWWNPAVESQATDRAYRIGQKKNVTVYRFITMGTFEEKIDEMIKSKKELADLVVSKGEKWVTEMSNKELKDMFSLSKENITND